MTDPPENEPSNEGSSSRRKAVLSDHKKLGSRFIPPAIHLMPSAWSFTSWRTTELPELVWLGLLLRKHGEDLGPALISKLGHCVRTLSAKPSSAMFGMITHFAAVTESEWTAVRTRLGTSGDLLLIQDAVRPLVALYPECPLRGLFFRPPTEPDDNDLFLMARTVGQLFDKELRSTVITQASFMALAIESGKFRIADPLEGEPSPLAQLPMVFDYPDTEISKRIASSLRAVIHAFFNPPHYIDGPSPWVSYFWNRGIEISPCFFLDPHEDDDDQVR